jgi:hypothetical protein
MTPSFIKIYGERHTGTNYLIKLIQLNLSAQVQTGVVPQYVMKVQNKLPGNETVRDIYFLLTFHNNFGWKHKLVKPDNLLHKYLVKSNKICFVTLTRNPYSWLLSLYDKPISQYYKNKPNFETFLTTPWKTVGRETAPWTICSPVALWNIKNAAYLKLHQKSPALNIKFEELLDDPQRILNLISDTFGYAWKTDTFINYEQSTKDPSKNYQYYHDYYLNEEWRERLSANAIAIINEQISSNVMESFCYQKI